MTGGRRLRLFGLGVLIAAAVVYLPVVVGSIVVVLGTVWIAGAPGLMLLFAWRRWRRAGARYGWSER